MDALMEVSVLGKSEYNDYVYFGKVVSIDGNPFCLTLYVAFVYWNPDFNTDSDCILNIVDDDIIIKAGYLEELKAKCLKSSLLNIPNPYVYVHPEEKYDKYSRCF